MATIKKTAYFAYADKVLAGNLTANAKIVLFVIANHFNWKNSDPTWISHATIARESSLSVSTVKRIINKLVEHGWLEKTGYKIIGNLKVRQYRPIAPVRWLSHGSNTHLGGSNDAVTWFNDDDDLNHKQIKNIEVIQTKKVEQRFNKTSDEVSLPSLTGWLRKARNKKGKKK